MQCIILIAAPAAGKGTTAKYLEDKYNFKHISTGDLLRNEVKNNTELGKKIKSLIDKGSLVSDDVIMDLFEKKFSSLTSNVVLDGMRRTINQAKMLDEIDKKNDNVEINKVINIDIDKQIAIDRIVNRVICDKCGSSYNKNIIEKSVCTKCGGNLVSRDDDSYETYINRYDTYIKETKPLLDYYKDKVITINNNGSLEEMYKLIDKVFEGDDIK